MIFLGFPIADFFSSKKMWNFGTAIFLIVALRKYLTGGLTFDVPSATSNKAGYTATPVACGWAGAVIELTEAFGQEQ